jgi:endonuclease/exonuclease/phosphatase family metal-dependent hydrolase
MGRFAWSVGLFMSLRIHDIQGRGHRSPLVDREVAAVEGVVTQTGAHVFYMQDLVPDDDEATSEGIRVSSDARISIGDLVQVSGVVREARPGCTSCAATDEAFANLTTTQIVASEVAPIGHAVELPATTRLGDGPGERRPPSETIEEGVGDVEADGVPFEPARQGLDFYESLEGMRVEVDRARAVGPTVRVAGRGAEVAVVANDGAGAGPFTSRGGLLRRAGDDNPERILVTGGDLGTLDVGDGWSAPLTGVIDYSFGSFNLVAADAPRGLVLAPPRVATALLPGEVDDLTVATFNVRNLSPASPAAQFDGIAELITRDLGAPDVVVLQEIQDASGPVDDGTTDAADTYAALVDAIVARGGPRYLFRDVAPGDAEDGGEPGANIRVGFLVRQQGQVVVVERGGASPARENMVRDVAGAPQLALSPGRIDPENPAFLQSRKPVAIELRFQEEPIFVVGVHFKSQLGDAPLFGRFQPPDRSTRVQRTAQARVVADFAHTILAVDPAALVIVAGDMNDGEASPPLEALLEVGLSSACARLPEAERYTYVFQGNAEVTDHVLTSRALAQRVVDARMVHTNADFARAPSDHDPVVVRMSLRDTRRMGAACRCNLASAPHAGEDAWALVLAALLARRGQTQAGRRPRRVTQSNRAEGRAESRKATGPKAAPSHVTQRMLGPRKDVPTPPSRFLSGPTFSGKDRPP